MRLPIILANSTVLLFTEDICSFGSVKCIQQTALVKTLKNFNITNLLQRRPGHDQLKHYRQIHLNSIESRFVEGINQEVKTMFSTRRDLMTFK